MLLPFLDEAGDSAEPFSIQCIAKVFSLVLALGATGEALWNRELELERGGRATLSSIPARWSWQTCSHHAARGRNAPS